MPHNWDEHLRGRLAEWERQGLARALKIASGTGTRIRLNGREVLAFASNDYLGLAAHPHLVAAAKMALDESGTGSTASPLIVGHHPAHEQLELALAAFKRSEATLVFPSGFQAAVATLGALAAEDDTIVLDRLAHASLIDGARLSGARLRTFKHNDTTDLEAILKKEQKPRCIVVVESLYSMDGDLAPLNGLIALARKHGALLLIDEAHATGVIGERGRGALESIGDAMPANVIAMGTLSKALGSQGGFVCARRIVIDTIVHAGRAYLFSTALAPASAAAALAALKLIDSEPQRRTHLLELTHWVRGRLKEMGIRAIDAPTPIIAVIAGDERRATDWSAALLERNIYVPAIRYPTVKKGQARLRISLSAAHTKKDCQLLLDALSM